MHEDEDCGSYEIDLSDSFNLPEFKRRAESGIGKLWMVCFDEPEISRFTGILYPNRKKDPSVLLMIDITDRTAFVNAPWKQSHTKLEIARIVMKELGGTKMYKDGVEVQ